MEKFSGFTTLGVLEEIQISESQCELEHFKGKIIFMSMFNDIVWRERGNIEHRKVYTSTGNISSCFFIWRELVSVCSFSFLRRSNYFLSS